MKTLKTVTERALDLNIKRLPASGTIHPREIKEAFTQQTQDIIEMIEGMKKKGLERVEHDYVTCYECGGYDECDCSGYNQAIHDVIDMLQKYP